jgi:hypothetical protein
VRVKALDVVGASALLLAVTCAVPPATADPVVPLDEFSPAFLGMFRKVLEIEDDIRRHAATYEIDADLAVAVCLYESGGNAGVSSKAGAQGLFQVMPATFRELRVPTNVEAGVKYLSQLIRQFGREDRAVAAYNGGPGRVSRGGNLPLETLQYVAGVGYYRAVLKQHDRALRVHAAGIRLEAIGQATDWGELSRQVGVPMLELRLHNPFIARRRLRAGDVVAIPTVARHALFTTTAGGVAYRVRHGDHYITLAHVLGVDLDELRTTNHIWHTQVVPTGTLLRFSRPIDGIGEISHVAVDPLTPAVTQMVGARAPGAGSLQPAGRAGRAAVGSTTARAAAQPQWHRVTRGDTLGGLALRFGTSVGELRRLNHLRGTTIRDGQRLRIPPSSAGR